MPGFSYFFFGCEAISFKKWSSGKGPPFITLYSMTTLEGRFWILLLGKYRSSFNSEPEEVIMPEKSQILPAWISKEVSSFPVHFFFLRCAISEGMFSTAAIPLKTIFIGWKEKKRIRHGLLGILRGRRWFKYASKNSFFRDILYNFNCFCLASDDTFYY